MKDNNELNINVIEIFSAECIDTDVGAGYSCRCKPGYQDVSIDRQNSPGRSCRRSNQCTNSDCAPEVNFPFFYRLKL